MTTSAQIVKTAVDVITNSPSQDYTRPDDHTSLTYDMIPAFKPLTVLQSKLENTYRLLQFVLLKRLFLGQLPNYTVG